MKKLIYNLFLSLTILFMSSGCNEEEYALGVAPGAEDAAFSYAVSEENDNIINFSNNTKGFIKNWSFGNGTSAKGDNVTGTFPIKGTYEVTLVVYSEGGSASSTQTIEIAETDPTLLDIPAYNFLTGGAEAVEGKTWVVDKYTAGHLGIGPTTGTWPEWYAAQPNEKDGTGLYDDEITFKLENFEFDYEANGSIYANAGYGAEFPNATQEENGADFIVPYTAPANLTWNMVEVSDGKWELKINGGHLGYYTGASPVYEVLSLSENELYVRSVQGGVPGNVWYQRFIPKGYTPPVEEPEVPETSTLPVDFETVASPFNGFGGSTFAVADNPDASGANTSAKVGKTDKGVEVWAGIETILAEKLDFSVNNTFKIKVNAPKTGVVRFKIEDKDDNTKFVEVDANITKVNEWEELTFDFSGTPSDTYNKIALFFDFGSADQNTFYFDDISLAAAGCTDEAEEALDPAVGINFTVGSANFGQFGNIVAERVVNPFVEGINTSCFVNSYGKTAGCETWSGTGYLLENAIDFGTTSKKRFKLKVYAVDQVTEVTVRLERLAHPDTEPSAERTATISATGQWEELTFDFSDITDPNTYKNILIYFEKGAPCDEDLYYFDDLVQIE